jgi:hypothetical protein
MKHAPLHVLGGRALHSALRHWRVYGIAMLFVLAAEAAVVAAWRSPAAFDFVSAVCLPIFVTVVYAFVLADADGTMTSSAIWSRVLERAWAVIVIDLIVGIISQFTIIFMESTDLLTQVFAIPSLLLVVTFVFADVNAVATKKADPWWMLVLRPFAVSFATALGPGMLVRAFLLTFVTQYLPMLVLLLLDSVLTARHVPFADFWAFGPLGAILVPPFGALTALVYLDATGYESERSRNL